ncbi:hypothetical protein ABPG74_018460 [Tetrahymena malaccensis]
MQNTNRVEVEFIFIKSDFKQGKKTTYTQKKEIKNFFNELKNVLKQKEIDFVQLNTDSSRAFESKCSKTKQIVEYPINIFNNLQDLEETISQIVIDENLCVRPNNNIKYSVKVISPNSDLLSQQQYTPQTYINQTSEETQYTYQDDEEEKQLSNKKEESQYQLKKCFECLESSNINLIYDQDAQQQLQDDLSQKLMSLKLNLEEINLENQQKYTSHLKKIEEMESQIKKLGVQNKKLPKKKKDQTKFQEINY